MAYDVTAKTIMRGMVVVEPVGHGALFIYVPYTGAYAIAAADRVAAVDVYAARNGGVELVDQAEMDSIDRAVQWARVRVLEAARRLEA